MTSIGTCGGSVLKRIIPNFVDNNDLLEIQKQIQSVPRWQFHHQKLDPEYNIVGSSTGSCIWRYRIIDGLPLYKANDPSTWLANQPHWRQNVHPCWLRIFDRVQATAGAEYTILRYAINGTMMGQLGTPHTDVPADCDTGTTWLLYLNPEWNALWGGSTTFYKGTALVEDFTVPFEPGKMVEFDGRHWHIAQPPNVPNLLRLAMVVIGRYS